MRTLVHGWVLMVAILVVAAVAATAHGATDRRPAKPPPRKAVPIPAGNSVIAVARRRHVPIYRRPNARKPMRVLGRGLYGSKRVFLVAGQRRRWTWPRWVKVHLPARPNGSRGWVRARDVKFLLDPYALEVNLARRVLTLRRGTRVVFRSPIGVGRDAWPTPTGNYYVTELLRTPNPEGAYGPYAFGISAFSNVFTRFGNGPGQVGIHGTNQPWLIGRKVSHGCIRLANDAIVRLAKTVPLGTPVRIVQSAPAPSLRKPPVQRVRPQPVRTTAGTLVAKPRATPATHRGHASYLTGFAARTLGLAAAPWLMAASHVLDLHFLRQFWRDLGRLLASASR